VARPCPPPPAATALALPVAAAQLDALAEYHQLDDDEVMLAGDPGRAAPGHAMLIEDRGAVADAIMGFLLQR